MRKENIYVIFFICVLILVLSLFSIRGYNKLKRCKDDIVYHHAKNSLIQAKKFLGNYAIRFVIFNVIYIISCCMINYCEISIKQIFLGREDDIGVSLLGIKLLQLILDTIFVFVVEFIFSRIVYVFTEVKHISPYDGIGRMNIGNFEANTFFRYMVIHAGILIVLIEILLIYINIVFSIMINIINIIIVILGLCDLLQNDNYYKDNYPQERETLPFREKWYINNIYRYFKDIGYRREHSMVLRENLKNIGYGMLNIFSRY